MMKQYQQLKSENPDALLLFRLGDFYELFGDDAKEASRLLEITLTARASGEGRVHKIPMCGVPHHAAGNYINRLLKAGRKVAIVEQMEDPRQTKGMVRRELVRVITPGTLLSPESLEARQNNYLVAVAGTAEAYGLAATDLSTGEFLISEFSGKNAWEELRLEIGRLQPSEVLLPDDLDPAGHQRFSQINHAYFTRLEGYLFDPDAGRSRLLDYFKVSSLDGFGCGHFVLGLGAAAAALHYLAETQRSPLSHIHKLTPYSIATHMRLDEATIRNLELVKSLADGTRRHTLLEVLDFTRTAMGARRLRQWVLRPLLVLEDIRQRQSGVTEFVKNTGLRQNLAEILGRMHDLERLAGRVGAQTATPRDVASLGATLNRLPEIKTCLPENTAAPLSRVAGQLPECAAARDLIQRALVEQPPISLKGGDIIRPGYNTEVDELRHLTREGKGIIAQMQAREREQTGIGSLKVEFNQVFGYYIEVSKANAKLVPEHYQRKQTLVNAERYITPELKEYEQKVLHAQDRLLDLEQELFLKLRGRVSETLPDIQQAAGVVANLDALLSLAECALRNQYAPPQVDEGDEINILEGRHPVVEQLTSEKFIPNDTQLNKDEHKVLIITGPNMAGKSTYLRQTALIVIMAQLGGWVPARQARIGWVDRVFTRVGAADNLAGGQSTFMVEMNESANILNNATPRSLVILDEVGRGTSTFDGVSIAWSVAEYLHDQVDAKTLFATHYYELTELALSKPQIKNFNIAVREWKDEIIFLRKILEGSTDRSYGIQVARLAGLPDAVIVRAREVLVNLEKANYTDSGASRLAEHAQDTPQMSLFDDQQASRLLQALRTLTPEHLTPLEALNELARLKREFGAPDE